MRRREFIGLLAGGTIAWPLAGKAQQRKLPTIGFLGPTSASMAQHRIAAFEAGLRERGWTRDENVAIDYRWADGKAERFAELAAGLVTAKADVIVTWGTPTAIAVKKATPVIPIVFTVVGDPVGSGLVASLPRPGGNVTGMSSEHPDAAGKRLDLLREMLPDMHRLAILVNGGNSSAMGEKRDIEALTGKLGISTLTVDVRQEEFESALEQLKGRADGLYIASDALVNANRAAIAGAALNARLPSIAGFEEIVAAGGLMAYAPNFLDLFRGAADYVDRILRGAKPAELPVQQPTTFELAINRKTAEALGLKVPPTLLARADKVIE
jgi:putative ABC transport system substrate-binding protein